MIVSGIEKKYNEYLTHSNMRWVFANSILYRMCRENPYHNDEHVIVAKIWLIGRAYSAAIERRKNTTNSSADFYYDDVAPKMLSIGNELDKKLDTIKKWNGPKSEEISQILDTHKFLMDIFYKSTELEKRSLASKYLHFHCPEKFFIYDSRARQAISKLVKKPDRQVLNGCTYYDVSYGDFVCRMLELQNYLNEKNHSFENPRKLDGFLLYAPH